MLATMRTSPAIRCPRSSMRAVPPSFGPRCPVACERALSRLLMAHDRGRVVPAYDASDGLLLEWRHLPRGVHARIRHARELRQPAADVLALRIEAPRLGHGIED